MEDVEGDGTVTDIYSVPVKVRNIDSVTDLPVDPERRTPRSSHQANPGEMVEIPLNEGEKCKHMCNQDLTFSSTGTPRTSRTLYSDWLVCNTSEQIRLLFHRVVIF